MPSNTTYNPTNISDFQKTKLNFNAQGVTVNPTAGTSTNLDLTLSDDCLLTGAWLIVNDAHPGDYINFQVVDISGAFTGVPNTVVNQFITTWYVSASTNTQLDMVYPAKVYAGLTFRVIYTSTGLVSPFLAVNYKLHKVLI